MWHLNLYIQFIDYLTAVSHSKYLMLCGLENPIDGWQVFAGTKVILSTPRIFFLKHAVILQAYVTTKNWMNFFFLCWEWEKKAHLSLYNLNSSKNRATSALSVLVSTSGATWLAPTFDSVTFKWIHWFTWIIRFTKFRPFRSSLFSLV